MNQDLDTLKEDILASLKSEGIALFHGFTRTGDPKDTVFWDAERYPDYRLFLAAAKRLGIELVVFSHRELRPSVFESMTEELETSDLSRDEKRTIQRRLKELRVYEGFTCALELSVEYQGRLYIYCRRTDWYDEIMAMADEIEDAQMEDEDLEDDSKGGYFSHN